MLPPQEGKLQDVGVIIIVESVRRYLATTALNRNMILNDLGFQRNDTLA